MKCIKVAAPFMAISMLFGWAERATTAQTAAAANYGSFTVGGSSTSFYPVQFVNNITPYGAPNGSNTSNLVIYRSNTHENGSWFGTFNLVISFHPTNWGHFYGEFERVIYQTGTGSPFNDPVGDLADGSTASGGNDLIVWLRGGGTYHWRNTETTAGWSLANGNPSGTNITDSSGIARSAISSQSTFVTNAKNNFYLGAIGLAVTGNASFLANVGIGTMNPASLLSVGSSSQFQVNSSGAVTSGSIVSSGPIGIGVSPQYTLDVAGQIHASQAIYASGGITFSDGSSLSSANTLCGGDYAESVGVTGDRSRYEPGDLLVIDPSDPSKFLKSAEQYSSAVAGIYSTKPGTLGRRQSTPKGPDEIPMAVVGIVPAKVSAENGPIHPSDLLVSSSTVGYAMRGTDRSRMLGAVVGKAMGSLESGTGVIEVLVTLQ